MKNHSRLVRKIAQTLILYDVCPYHFRESFINPETQNNDIRKITLLDIIERAVRGETIKKSELEDLRLKANSADCYQELWEASEQEIKEQNATVSKLRDEFKYALAARDSQIANLYKQARTLESEREPRGFWAKLFGKLSEPPTEAKPESNCSFETGPQV